MAEFLKMIRILSFLIVFFLISPCCTLEATTVFSSKWASAGSGVDNDNDGNADPNDNANWHYAYENMTTDSELLRVSGDQSGVGNGGPSSAPPLAPSTTYYLRMKRIGNNSTDSEMYLQDNFGQYYTELYGGMWFYFEDSTTFINSIKLFDFKDGDTHNTLFTFAWDASYCIDNDYGPCDYSNIGSDCYGDWPASHNIVAFKYRKSVGVNGCEGMFDYWDSSVFDQNLDSNGDPIPSRTYDKDNVSRVKIEGGKWMALIVHVKYHATDGIIEMWLYDGSSLQKAMEWDKNSVWNAAGGSDGHDFYTLSPSGNGANQLQVNSYWNNWTTYTGTKYVWISNVIVATTYDEVKDYLGLDEDQPALQGIVIQGDN